MASLPVYQDGEEEGLPMMRIQHWRKDTKDVAEDCKQVLRRYLRRSSSGASDAKEGDRTETQSSQTAGGVFILEKVIAQGFGLLGVQDSYRIQFCCHFCLTAGQHDRCMYSRDMPGLSDASQLTLIKISFAQKGGDSSSKS